MSSVDGIMVMGNGWVMVSGLLLVVDVVLMYWLLGLGLSMVIEGIVGLMS